MEYRKDLPAPIHWEVIVAGGGPAGCAAAAASAREGKRTLLIESTGSLGGMGTSGLVPAWCPFSDKERIIYGGLAQRVFEASSREMAHVRARENWWDWVPIDAEALKRVYDDLLHETGAQVLFFTQVVDVQCDRPGHIAAIITANKEGLRAYTADVIIDCTGDADLAVLAGAQWVQGDETGDLQPATLCFTLTNVDEYAYLNGPSLHPNNPDSLIYRIIREGRYPAIPDTHLCNNLIGPRTVGFNAGHLWQVDNTDPASVSRAMREGRTIAKAFRDALAEYFPAAFASAQLIATAPLMGVRETRRIVGEYTLTMDDYFARRSFPDEIGRNCYYIDVHHNPAQSDAAKSTEGYERHAQAHDHRYGPGESHGIPYRCLLPKGLDNLLIAGRSISCDRPVQGSVRVMPPCLVTGEAAGLAAAMAVETATSPGAIDVDRLRARLKAHGAYLP